MDLFTDKSSDPKVNAQRNLCGRTHYVDDGTLRFHHSRILSAHVLYGGLMFAIVESYSKDMHNTKRGYRGVVFDVFGTVVSRPNMETGSCNRNAATTAMWDAVNELDAKWHTQNAIARARHYFDQEMTQLSEKTEKLVQRAI